MGQSLEQTSASKSRSRSTLWALRGLAVAVVISGSMLALRGGGVSDRDMEDALRPFGMVPTFALRERSGRQLTRDDLLGRVWIADFIFTRCVDVCPLVSGRMAQLQEAFAAEDDVRLVSITVDPEHDTPEVLARYAENFGAHPRRWLFLTGDKETIYRLAREGFHLGVIDPNDARQSSAMPVVSRVRQSVRAMLQVMTPTPASAHDGEQHQDETRQAIQHSARFVLVDRHGRIRQYYDTNDANALPRLQRHVRFLLRKH